MGVTLEEWALFFQGQGLQVGASLSTNIDPPSPGNFSCVCQAVCKRDNEGPSFLANR